MNLLGKLSWDAIPLDQPIIMGATAFMVLVIVAVLAFITVKGYWEPLWRDWITSVDHKRIGVMYILLALVMLLRGFSDAIMMRAQQAVAVGGAQGYLPPEHFDQIFSAHGTIMIFFMAMPFVIGVINVVVPLQLGVRDVAFPTLNSVSFWLTASGALLINISLAVGEFAKTGWVAYPPLSELQFSPGVGVDYYLWSLQISGIGTLLSGINFVTTILKLRAPGMGYMRMPVFCWTALATSLLIVAAFPVLTATFAMLLLDRYLGFHFFTVDGGGNAMMYVNLFWVWGHPEVYILVLPAFGIYSEVVATFSGKPLFGYRSMVAATMAICVLSFLVWLHHFFTMGASADVNGFFGVMTMIIAVPTGVKVFNWLFTMYGGRVRFTVPMLWSIGFMITFVVGGMTGVLMAVPPADFQVHNSLFLVAHFHNTIIGGVVFGLMAGYNYWFPKVFGFRLDERWGKASFWCWFVGFYLAFMPLYAVGLMGMTRRLQHYDNPAWQPWLMVAALGAVVILAGVACQAIQLVVSVRDRRLLRDTTGNPWAGRTLEWFTPSPPPAWNFTVLPSVGRFGRHDAGQRDAGLQGDRNAEQQPDRIHHGLLRRRHRLCLDLAHLVDGGAGPARRLRHAARLRLPPPGGGRSVRRRDRPLRPRSSGGGHAMNVAVALSDVPPDGGGKRSRPGAEASRRRLRLLDLPAERHRDVRDAVCGLCRAGARDRRRAERRAVVQPGKRRHRNGLPPCLELHLRTDVAGGEVATSSRHLFRRSGHLRARPGVPRARAPGVRRHDRPRRRPAAQRLPVRLLHPGRLPWAARDGRAGLAGRDDGPGGPQGLSPHRAAPPGLLLPVLARARHRLGVAVHGRLSDGSPRMTDTALDRPPGDPSMPAESEERESAGVLVYTIGLLLAVGLTATSFWVANTGLLWGPGVPLGLVVLAVAQMGIHLVFFLHITTGPDNTNNVLALAFGILTVLLVVVGSLWIMADLNDNMMPPPELMNLHMRH